MDKQRKPIFGTKRALVLAGVLILLFSGGVVFLAKRLQSGNLAPDGTNSIPIVNDSGLPPDSDRNSSKYDVRIKLSDGQPQPNVVKDIPPSQPGYRSCPKKSKRSSRAFPPSRLMNKQNSTYPPMFCLPRDLATRSKSRFHRSKRSQLREPLMQVHFRCCASPRRERSRSRRSSVYVQSTDGAA
jgi:hypothetical protein